jgi:hypothetical protein
MTALALKDLMKRAEAWSEEDREKLMRAARIIEDQHASGFDLSPADWKIIDARIEAAIKGDIATEEETEAFFAKYRVA